jgi:hypothetical protein
MPVPTTHSREAGQAVGGFSIENDLDKLFFNSEEVSRLSWWSSVEEEVVDQCFDLALNLVQPSLTSVCLSLRATLTSNFVHVGNCAEERSEMAEARSAMAEALEVDACTDLSFRFWFL